MAQRTSAITRARSSCSWLTGPYASRNSARASIGSRLHRIDRSTAGSARHASPQSITPTAAPCSSTRTCRACRSPCTIDDGTAGGSPRAASSQRPTEPGTLQRPSRSPSPNRSCVSGTRRSMSVLAVGSTGNSNSASIRAATSLPCSSRRNEPSRPARRRRAASLRPAHAASRPRISSEPKNGNGYPSTGRPTKTGTGIGSDSSGARCGSTASSRSMQARATARRGKQNTQRSSTSQTLLSQPSPNCPSASRAVGTSSRFLIAVGRLVAQRRERLLLRIRRDDERIDRLLGIEQRAADERLALLEVLADVVGGPLDPSGVAEEREHDDRQRDPGAPAPRRRQRIDLRVDALLVSVDVLQRRACEQRAADEEAADDSQVQQHAGDEARDHDQRERGGEELASVHGEVHQRARDRARPEKGGASHPDSARSRRKRQAVPTAASGTSPWRTKPAFSSTRGDGPGSACACASTACTSGTANASRTAAVATPRPSQLGAIA